MTLIDLWLPILVSAVLVFLASAIIWTVFKWHNSDYRQTDDEAGVRKTLSGSQPGFYVVPYCMAAWTRRTINSPTCSRSTWTVR
jgi:hypothetical protein